MVGCKDKMKLFGNRVMYKKDSTNLSFLTEPIYSTTTDSFPARFRLELREQHGKRQKHIVVEEARDLF